MQGFLLLANVMSRLICVGPETFEASDAFCLLLRFQLGVQTDFCARRYMTWMRGEPIQCFCLC